MYIIIFILLAIIAFLIADRITSRYNIQKKPPNTTYLLKEESEIVKRGQIGEYKIYQNLNFMEDYGCKILTNLYIPSANGKTTEIDMILITHKGIFVIESKNFKGWIFGEKKQKYWAQTFPNGEKKDFFNPIWQNQNHIKQLSHILKDEYYFSSIIAFSDDCTLKKVPVDADGVHIVYYSNVATKIIELCNFMPSNVLNAKKIQSIYKTLLPYTQVDKGIKEKHLEEVKVKSERKVVEKKTDSISTKTKIELPVKESLKCPKCGASLKKITSKKTSKTFWGCSNFPKCKFTKKID